MSWFFYGGGPINCKGAVIPAKLGRAIECVDSLLSIFLVDKGNKAKSPTNVTLFSKRAKRGTGDLTKRLEKVKEISVLV
ncbi:hypothetical protein A2U01_0074379, partial [Trifolium medium]|nr:hypothetical protein [Trifolium medium]